MSATEPRLGVVGLAIALAFGCGGQTAEPEFEPPSPYRALLERAIEHGLPGVALAIDKPGGEPWIGVAGDADLLEPRALSVDSPFHLASVTKAVTAVAVLRLVERGELRLDDRVVDRLDPSLVADLPSIDRIELRHLLKHSSGLYSFNNDRAYWARLIGPDAFSGLGWTTPELLDLVRGNPPSGEPGSGFYYADTNYLLLGEVVASVIGRDFRDVVRAEVFEPLAMSSAYFYSSYRDGREPLASPPVEGYLVMSEVMETFDVHTDFPETPSGLLQATMAHERSDTAAGVVASAPDMLRFARALFRPGFLSDASREVLFEPLRVVEASGDDEAGGVLRAYAKPWGRLLTAEGDGPGGVHTLLAHHPQTDTIVVAFTNVFGRWDEMDFLLDEVTRAAVE